MASYYIRGENVPCAQGYGLYKKDGSSYTLIAEIDNTKPNIYFNLADYEDKLTPGRTYQLVVKAIGEGGVDIDGDGTIYIDSEYSPAVSYTSTKIYYENYQLATGENIFDVSVNTNTKTVIVKNSSSSLGWFYVEGFAAADRQYLVLEESFLLQPGETKTIQIHSVRWIYVTNTNNLEDSYVTIR